MPNSDRTQAAGVARATTLGADVRDPEAIAELVASLEQRARGTDPHSARVARTRLLQLASGGSCAALRGAALDALQWSDTAA